MKKEPVLTVAAVTSVVSALVTLLVVFGVPLDDAEQKAVLGFVGAVAPLALAYFARKRVSPAQ